MQVDEIDADTEAYDQYTNSGKLSKDSVLHATLGREWC